MVVVVVVDVEGLVMPVVWSKDAASCSALVKALRW